VRSRLGYEGDLLDTDTEVARFLAALDELGLADRTLVIITADHGEALGEHGLVGHGWFMLEPVLHVPLILRAPGRVPAGRRVGALASLADLPPTILELVGAPPGPPMQGASLVPLLANADDERFRDRVLHAEKRGKDWILIARRGDTKWEVRPSGVKRYDLASDPEEKSPAPADDDPAIGGTAFAERYRADNDAFRARLGSAAAPASVPVDDSVRSKLRALGYTE
jgi:arylsulfatase A-like enzyme